MKAGETYEHPRYVDDAGKKIQVRITKVNSVLGVAYYRTVSSSTRFDGFKGCIDLKKAEQWRMAI